MRKREREDTWISACSSARSFNENSFKILVSIVYIFQLLSEAAQGRLSIHSGDILSFNMENIIPENLAVPWDSAPPNIHIIGNLPFSVSTPLIIMWLAAMSNQSGPWKFGRTKLTLTFQKEVAERMTANILSKQRCRLSVMCQYLCKVDLKFVIPGKSC